MIELPLVFLGGFLGSAHCVGMCGGFAVSIGVGAKSFTANLQRQLVYTLGRVLTYSFFGVVAGYAGFWLSRRVGTLVHVQAALSILAGCVLLLQGLLALGILPRKFLWAVKLGGTPCLAGTFVGPFLTSPGWLNVLLAGVLTGFLPCGLVYGFLSLA
ncbi:MAG: sulfite exporter TauE/SafE family protein, partial [Planctomycetaceae bacterium]|nr:sulfite exporter TauE/SafE family protein [Planctomycetaceae bacterium]